MKNIKTYNEISTSLNENMEKISLNDYYNMVDDEIIFEKEDSDKIRITIKNFRYKKPNIQSDIIVNVKDLEKINKLL